MLLSAAPWLYDVFPSYTKGIFSLRVLLKPSRACLEIKHGNKHIKRTALLLASNTLSLDSFNMAGVGDG